MLIAVTGANGFVGRRLVSFLRDAGHEVREIVRQATSPSQFECGSLESEIDWSKILRDVEVVVHTAARVHQMQDDPQTAEPKYLRVNHQATVELARQAASNGVRRFVFLSSIKVNGEATTADRPFRSTDQIDPQDPYGRSKSLAEADLLAMHQAGDLECVIIRPPLVYGPGVKANFLRLVRAVAKGLPLPFSLVKNRRSMVAVGNLCDLIRVSCESSAAAGRILMVSDDHDYSTPELVREIARALDRSPRLFPVPPVALRLLGRLTGKSKEVERLLGSCHVDISTTKRLLNWSPPIDSASAIRETIAAAAEVDAGHSSSSIEHV